MSKNNIESIKIICPDISKLSAISNKICCEKCNMIFSNESSFRMHDIKVHEKKKLEKMLKENVRYQCPVNGCIYSTNNTKYFTLFKYLKQVRCNLLINLTMFVIQCCFSCCSIT